MQWKSSRRYRLSSPLISAGLYVMGQSMGGAGTWNIIAPAAAVRGSRAMLRFADRRWNVALRLSSHWGFHGVPTLPFPSRCRGSVSPDRKAGGHPLYTEYSGVGHNVSGVGFHGTGTCGLVFAQRRPA